MSDPRPDYEPLAPLPCAENNCGDEAVGTGVDGEPYCRVHYPQHQEPEEDVDVDGYQEALAERAEAAARNYEGQLQFDRSER